MPPTRSTPSTRAHPAAAEEAGRPARFDPDAPPAELAGSAEWAVRQARTALDCGDHGAARRWLGRAARLVPNETTVPLMLAAATVGTDPQQACSILAGLAAKFPDYRDGVVALAATLLRAGRAAEAADRLDGLLGRMAPPPDPAFIGVAEAVCAAIGAPGWVWLDGSGTCRARLVGRDDAELVRLELDGAAAGVLRPRGGRPAARPLAVGWRRAGRLAAMCGGARLLGSGLAPFRFSRVDGFVTAGADGGVTGWARMPADPQTVPALVLRRPGGGQMVAFAAEPERVDERAGGGALRWRFMLGADALAGLDVADIADSDGRRLWGSPVILGAERAAARRAAQALAGGPAAGAAAREADRFRPLPAALLPMPARPGTKPARLPPCDVIVPVHGGLDELELCLASLAATLPRASQLVLVDDGSPDPAVGARLSAAQGPGVTVLRHAQARGFPAAVNAGLEHLRPEAGRDVVILNADTIVSRHWLARLSAAAHADPAIGSCTPLTNDGSIVSYPTPGKAQEAPGTAALAALNRLCWQANGPETVTIPTGVGFCMLIKGACLLETGTFREDVFAQGYGEENDWCLRAAHLGWRHAAAPGVFVSHSGGRSFGAAKALLMERNAAVLERLHPGYTEFVLAALERDALQPARRRIDRLRLLQAPLAAAVALVTHDAGGGVARHVARRSAALAAEGRQPIVLSPDEAAFGRCQVSLGLEEAGALPNLRFDLPEELPQLAALLQEAKVEAFEIHHLLHHHPAVSTLPAVLGVPYDVFVHDYGHWCPRISLTSRGNRYCGEPLSPVECEECVADLGSRYDPPVSVIGLRRDSGRLLAGAREVAVSCEDVAARIRRQFPSSRPLIRDWEAPAPALALAAQRGAEGTEVGVVVAGAIGIEKGYEVLLACARDAARRRLPLRFTVVGHTLDDDRLMAHGCAFVTGRFAEVDGAALVRAQGGSIGFVPSVCPETWCYALSLLWEAGLPVLGFALGAQGERIGRSGRGWLLPPGLGPAKINDALVSRGLEAIHRQSGQS